jgi:hypothetical protein
MSNERGTIKALEAAAPPHQRRCTNVKNLGRHTTPLVLEARKNSSTQDRAPEEKLPIVFACRNSSLLGDKLVDN